MESLAPAFKKKGRVSVGADADLILFDPEVVIDRATYQEPTLPPEGMRHVLVNGVPVVRDGSVQEGVSPGRGIRAPGA
jgi:N-acyl-D-aspartate/D-glutamate deacylase